MKHSKLKHKFQLKNHLIFSSQQTQIFTTKSFKKGLCKLIIRNHSKFSKQNAEISKYFVFLKKNFEIVDLHNIWPL